MSSALDCWQIDAEKIAQLHHDLKKRIIAGVDGVQANHSSNARCFRWKDWSHNILRTTLIYYPSAVKIVARVTAHLLRCSERKHQPQRLRHNRYITVTP